MRKQEKARKRYYLPAAGQVNLSVSDLQVNEIMVLVNEQETEVYHQIILDGNYLQPRAYKYVLRAVSNSLSRKMVAVKHASN